MSLDQSTPPLTSTGAGATAVKSITLQALITELIAPDNLERLRSDHGMSRLLNEDVRLRPNEPVVWPGELEAAVAGFSGNVARQGMLEGFFTTGASISAESVRLAESCVPPEGSGHLRQIQAHFHFHSRRDVVSNIACVVAYEISLKVTSVPGVMKTLSEGMAHRAGDEGPELGSEDLFVLRLGLIAYQVECERLRNEARDEFQFNTFKKVSLQEFLRARAENDPSYVAFTEDVTRQGQVFSDDGGLHQGYNAFLMKQGQERVADAVNLPSANDFFQTSPGGEKAAAAQYYARMCFCDWHHRLLTKDQLAYFSVQTEEDRAALVKALPNVQDSQEFCTLVTNIVEIGDDDLNERVKRLSADEAAYQAMFSLILVKKAIEDNKLHLPPVGGWAASVNLRTEEIRQHRDAYRVYQAISDFLRKPSDDEEEVCPLYQAAKHLLSDRFNVSHPIRAHFTENFTGFSDPVPTAPIKLRRYFERTPSLVGVALSQDRKRPFWKSIFKSGWGILGVVVTAVVALGVIAITGGFGAIPVVAGAVAAYAATSTAAGFFVAAAGVGSIAAAAAVGGGLSQVANVVEARRSARAAPATAASRLPQTTAADPTDVPRAGAGQGSTAPQLTSTQQMLKRLQDGFGLYVSDDQKKALTAGIPERERDAHMVRVDDAQRATANRLTEDAALRHVITLIAAFNLAFDHADTLLPGAPERSSITMMMWKCISGSRDPGLVDAAILEGQRGDFLQRVEALKRAQLPGGEEFKLDGAVDAFAERISAVSIPVTAAPMQAPAAAIVRPSGRAPNPDLDAGADKPLLATRPSRSRSSSGS